MKQHNKIKRLAARIYIFEHAVFKSGEGPIQSSYNRPGSLKK